MSDPSAKPMVIRKVAKNAIQNSAPVKRPPLNPGHQSKLLKITGVPSPAAPFTWAKSISKVSYQLDFSLGKQFQPRLIGDEDRDMAIGFDFGLHHHQKLRLGISMLGDLFCD
jgi:hypothetical protein